MEPQTMTSFMGSETGAVNERVTKAMNASMSTKLSIQQFVTATEFKIDPIMVNYFWQVVAKNQGTHMGTLVNYFWQVVANNCRVHMHPTVLRFIGYDSTIGKKPKKILYDFLNDKQYRTKNCHIQTTDARCTTISLPSNAT